MIDAFDAAGKDLILLETVGTGQSEIDVAEVADVRIVVSAPGLGDDIQAMKSGLLEIADIWSSTRPTARAPNARCSSSRRTVSAPAHPPCPSSRHRHDRRGRAATRRGNRRRPSLDVAGRWRAAAAAPATSSPAPQPISSPSACAKAAGGARQLADEVLSGAIGPAEAARRLLGT